MNCKDSQTMENSVSFQRGEAEGGSRGSQCNNLTSLRKDMTGSITLTQGRPHLAVTGGFWNWGGSEIRNLGILVW